MHGASSDLAVLLLICALAGALFVRLRQPVPIAFILVGIVVGSAVFGLVALATGLGKLAFTIVIGFGLVLARRVVPQARLTLFNAYQVPFEEKLQFAAVDAQTIDLYRRQARASAALQMRALADACGLSPPDWDPFVIGGEASLRIVQHQQAQDFDRVVLGKHDQSVAEDLLRGSVSQHVLPEGGADVLVSTARQP